MKEDILRLRADGKTYREIQSELGCSLGVISYHCNPAQKGELVDRQRDRRSKNRKRLQEYKSGKACVDCGESYPYYVMDFDHLYDKSENVSMMLNNSWDTILKEIAKCELVCSNCHRFRSHARLTKHGGDVLVESL